IPALPLLPGEYRLYLSSTVNNEIGDRIENAFRFTVDAADVFGSGWIPRPHKHGSYFVEHSWVSTPLPLQSLDYSSQALSFHLIMTSVHHQEQFYNNRWQDFDFANRLKLARCINILNGLLGTKKVAPRIIDLGCGAGWLTSILGQFGPTVGVELSRRAVEEAARKFPHVTFIQADIFTWDYPKEEFDIVVSQEVIEHVDEQERYLAIAHDLLQPDGY